MEKELDNLDDNKKNKTENNKVSSKRKRNLIIALIIVLVIAIIAIVAVRVNVTTVAGSEDEMLSTLKIGSDGTYELTVVNYASSSDSNGEQNFIIQKTDEYGNPLQGVEFEIAGNFRTSYTVKFYDADNSNTIMSDYTQVFYGSHWDDKYITTDEEGKISLTLQYGDYGIAESKSLYGYEDDENVYWIRVDKSGINIIDESKVDWDDANFDEADTINVSTASIKDTLGSISGYTLDHIELNGTNLGTSEDNLPTTVNDGDVIKIYMIKEVINTGGTYTVNYYILMFETTSNVYNGFLYCLDIPELSYTVNDANLVNIDGTMYAELDFDKIDQIAEDYLISENYFYYSEFIFEIITDLYDQEAFSNQNLLQGLSCSDLIVSIFPEVTTNFIYGIHAFKVDSSQTFYDVTILNSYITNGSNVSVYLNFAEDKF